MWFLLVLLLALSPGAEAKPLPGAEALPAGLDARLKQALAGKGPGYQPRTEHLNSDGSPQFTNRLILEPSPYLLQHAHNPVNWYPWGDEAFERARKEHKPVLLSIGYSTCHWCHVMERESFEDEEIAAYLNRNYIAIKVDREQRPDIDAVYMSAVQMMSGSGGWPMTAWLTPERRPFYGGTYFPPRDGARAGRAGFLTLLKKLRAAWEEKPDQVAAAAQDIAGRLQAEAASADANPTFDASAAMRNAAAVYAQSFDAEHGGFGAAPKFPRPMSLEFLLRYARRTHEAQPRAMAVKTLEAMHAGGLYDHIGGGFHRYSTDARWLVPHFEKMLYDNALLAMVYLQAYQATGRADFATVARETLTYMTRDMSAPEGGFHSASDADSGGVEGSFFVWTPAEITAALGPERAGWFDALYGVTAEGNLDGRSILHLASPAAEVARSAGLSSDQFALQVTDARQSLYRARQRRVAPHVDQKIVVSWNGLAISAFARAALVFGDASYTERSRRAAEFVLLRLTVAGRLRRSFFDGRAEGTGYLDDYAFLIQGLLDLFEATGEVRWLRQAVELQKSLDAHFWDRGGGYFLTPDDGEVLLAREKPDDDGAEPSGNSIAALNLLRLAELTGDEDYRVRADQTLAALAPTLEQAPTALPAALSAVDFATGAPKEVAIVKPSSEADADDLLVVLRRNFVPNRVLVVTSDGASLQETAALVPWLRDKKAIGGKPTAFVCERSVCALPTSNAGVFETQLLASKSP